MSTFEAIAIADAAEASTVNELRSFGNALLSAGEAVEPFDVRVGRGPTILRGRLGGRTLRQSTRVLDPMARLAMSTVIQRVGAAISPQAPAIDLFAPVQLDLLDELRADAVDVLLTGLVAGLATPDLGRPDEEPIDRLLALAFGAGVRARTGREMLLRRSVPDLLPDDLLDRWESIAASGCFQRVREAARSFGGAHSDATVLALGSVTSIEPANQCNGLPITVTGHGFGRSPGRVLFTTPNGYVLVPATSWTAKKVTVTVPAMAIPGPFGLYPAVAPFDSSLGAAAAELAATLEECFGPSMAGKIAVFADIAAASLLVVNDNGRFEGGSPIVARFTADGSPGPINASPGKRVRFAWATENVDSVTIVASPGGPTFPPQLPASGFLDIDLPNSPWTGQCTLSAEGRCTTTDVPISFHIEATIGLALGGGGARGDFQVGALRYLYSRQVVPAVISSTSVGSVNALQLAHGGPSAFDKLERLWLDLLSGSDFFEMSPTATVIKQHIEQIFPSITAGAATGGAVGAGVGSAVSLVSGIALGPLGLLASVVAGAAAGGAIAAAEELMEFLTLLTRAFTDQTPFTLRVGGTTLTIQPVSGIFTMAPLGRLIDRHLDPAQVAASGIKLRMVSVALDDASIIAVDETGGIHRAALGRGRLEATGGRSTIRSGALASSAMPAIFEHQAVGPFTCVDGGVREVVPVGIAVHDLGASTVYAIVCSARPAPRASASSMSALSVFGSAVMDVPFDEMSVDDTEPQGGWPGGVDVHVIRPSFNLHDATVVEPGLIRIGMDYGYMRAADVVDVAATDRARAQALCDIIINARATAWRLEHHIYGRNYWDPHRDAFTHLYDGGLVSPPRDLPSTMQAAFHVRHLKREIARACNERIAMKAPIPATWPTWVLGWEHHGGPTTPWLPVSMPQAWVPVDSSPWSVLTLPYGIAPSDTPPA